jgi:hypothetical protein
VRLRLDVRELVLASWVTDADSVGRAVYPGLEPVRIGGEYLVSVAALRFAGGRLGALPVAPFAQLNVRTYVAYAGESAVYFLRSYVSLGGLGGALLGAPFRAARIRIRPGRVNVPAAGVSLPYAVGGGREAREPEAGELGAHELGLFEAAGLRAFRVRRGPARWRPAEPAGTVRADALLALGFDPDGPPAIVYTRDMWLETEVPARPAEPRSSESRSRR